jgi:hypothetical protein
VERRGGKEWSSSLSRPNSNESPFKTSPMENLQHLLDEIGCPFSKNTTIDFFNNHWLDLVEWLLASYDSTLFETVQKTTGSNTGRVSGMRFLFSFFFCLYRNCSTELPFFSLISSQ